MSEHDRPAEQHQPQYGQPQYGQPQSGQPQWTGQPQTQVPQPNPPVTKGFFSSLFDISFDTFVTPKVIRVLYLLIIIVTVLSAFVYIVLAFKASPGLGLLTLFVLAPLFTIIWLAIWRIILEAFMVIFRIAEDVRSMRNR